MKKISNSDVQLFTTIARMNQTDLLRLMRNFLWKHYQPEKIVATSKFILCEGTEPIMLVAHLDTVFKTPPIHIYLDKQYNVMWSPEGLGADDRAGVFAIIKIIQAGYRPHICLTTDEECGGIGASALIKKYPKPIFDIKYIIQLDRQGANDCVFYSCTNFTFQSFVEQYNFITEWGTFSDISVICPKWKVAGVNLSVGYYNEHSQIEALHFNELYTTIQQVQKMIEDAESAPSFKYIPSKYADYLNYIYHGYPMEEDYYDYVNKTCKCDHCGQIFLEEDVIPVQDKQTNQQLFYCIKCIDGNVNWCEGCGEAFKTTNKNDKYCPTCQKLFQQKVIL